jgi:tRNA(fMet)-specific endonuclease VapC
VAARRFGYLKAQLESTGEIIGDLDLQIASIALEQQSVLVTHNQKHFARLVTLAELALEDWLK